MIKRELTNIFKSFFILLIILFIYNCDYKEKSTYYKKKFITDSEIVSIDSINNDTKIMSLSYKYFDYYSIKLFDINKDKNIWELEVKTDKEDSKYVSDIEYIPSINKDKLIFLYKNQTYRIISSDNNSIQLWDINNHKNIWELKNSSKLVYDIEVISSNGSNRLLSLCKDKDEDKIAKIKILDIESKRIIKEIDINSLKIKGEYPFLIEACYNKNKTLMAIKGYNGEIILFDLTTFKEIKKKKIHDDNSFDIRFSSDDKYIYSFNNSEVKGWDININKIETIYKWEKNFLLGMDISSNNKYIGLSVSTVNEDYTMTESPELSELLIIDLNNKNKIRQLQGHKYPVKSLEFSPNGEIIASGEYVSGTIHLWDVESGKEIIAFHEHSYTVTDIKFTPDGKYLIAAGSRNKIIVWDVSSFH